MTTNQTNLLSALAAFQLEAVKITKDSKANYGKYVSLPKIIDELQPILNKHGLLITQFPSQTLAGEPALTTILAHPESGETKEYTAPLSMIKTDPQAQGSAITYMRRYSYASVTQVVVDEDDDGQQASPRDDYQQVSPNKISGLASDKQIGLIHAKVNGMKAGNPGAHKAFGEWYKATINNKPFEALTKAEASKVIDKLMGNVDETDSGGFDGNLSEYSDEVF